jgi:apolipoprotein N-acyltransferase
MTSKWLKVLAALLSGTLLGAAFPPWSLSFTVWIWPLPLLWALWCGQRSPKARRVWLKPAFLGLLSGLMCGMVSLTWVRHSSRVLHGAYGDEWMGWGVELLGWAAAFGLSLYCAFYTAIWAAWVDTVARPSADRLSSIGETLRCSFLAAAAWVALEWLRGWVLTGFGWNGLGVALLENKALIQAADLVGTAGLSFTPMMLGCLLFITGWRLVTQFQAGERFQRRWDLTLGIALLGAQLIYGMVKFTDKEKPVSELKVALVQQNVPQVDRWTAGPERLTEIYRRYAELTKLYAQDVDLVVWPESGLILSWYSPDHEPFLNDLLSAGDFHLLTGVDVIEPNEAVYNSAVLLHKKIESAKFHHKLHLVPFGEYVPGRNLIPGMNAVFSAILPADITPGTSTEPLSLPKPDVDLIPLICFEDTVGRVARRFIRNERPQVMVNLTNDGWFLNSIENVLHLHNAALRCVELRRPMVRSANTGITAMIDSRGVITDRLRDPETSSPFIQGVLPVRVPLPAQQPVTLYARWGDWFAMVMALTCLVELIRAAKSSRTPGVSSAETGRTAARD